MKFQLLCIVVLSVISSVLSGTVYAPNVSVPQSRYLVAEPRTTAEVVLEAGSDEGVSGRLIVEAFEADSQICISGVINGLTQGFHGFHVHMNGELGNQCKDAGGHFNPEMNNHSQPENPNRHAGDLGNILTPLENGPTHVSLCDKIITLGDGGAFDIAGRAIVVHAKADDLGLGGDEESLKTGNAGARLACGVINLID